MNPKVSVYAETSTTRLRCLVLRLVSPTLGLEIPMLMPRFLAPKLESIEDKAEVHVPKFIHAGLRILTLET